MDVPTASIRYVRSDHLLWRRTEDRILMLSLHGGGVMGLSATGMALWELLHRPISLTDAVDALGEDFGAPPEAVAADLIPLLAKLVEEGIVKQVREA